MVALIREGQRAPGISAGISTLLPGIAHSRWPNRNALHQAMKGQCALHSQTVHVDHEHGLVVLPMGRGRPSVVLHLDLPEGAGARKLVWRDGFELHCALSIWERPKALQ